MYYHVIIETKNKESHYELDKQDNDEILRRFVKPYIQGKQIQIDGYFLKKEDITRFKITQSDDSAATMHREYISQLHANGIMAGISPESLIEEKKDITEALFEKVKTEVQVQQTSKVFQTDNNKVFIVHGHDDMAKIEVARFLEKLGLNAVILSEQPNEGKTIIEKLEVHTDAGFGIVLYTPDDEGRLIVQEGPASDSQPASELQLPKRARQNVVFEHGPLIGKLGRNKVVALKKGVIELPNDFSGVVYIDMDNQGAWCLRVAKELKAAGYTIDMNKLVE